jgi:hypothetical protein
VQRCTGCNQCWGARVKRTCAPECTKGSKLHSQLSVTMWWNLIAVDTGRGAYLEEQHQELNNGHACTLQGSRVVHVNARQCAARDQIHASS